MRQYQISLRMLDWSKCFLISALIIFNLGACKKNEATLEGQSEIDKTIKIGMALPLSGSEASYGRDCLRGAQLGADEINAGGGILGRRIQLIARDNQSKAGETSLIIRDLISRSHVSALLGEGSTGRSLEAAPVAQKIGIPFISSGSTNIKVTKIGNFIFRMCFTDTYQGKAMADFAYSTLGKRNVAIILDNSKDYSIGLAQSFAKNFIKQGGNIVVQQSYSAGDKDFSAQLTAVKAANPDAVFLPSFYTEAASIISQARQFGVDVPFLGGDGWNPAEFLKLGGSSIEGVYFADHFSADNKTPVIQEFVKNYQEKFGVPPSSLAALAYDSIKLFADSVKRAGTVASVPLRDALASVHNFPGVTGTITFDQDRNPKKAAVIIQVRDGKFHFVETAESP